MRYFYLIVALILWYKPNWSAWDSTAALVLFVFGLSKDAALLFVTLHLFFAAVMDSTTRPDESTFKRFLPMGALVSLVATAAVLVYFIGPYFLLFFLAGALIMHLLLS